jgi:ribosomal protein S18 acetylase RimI-like enzyme
MSFSLTIPPSGTATERLPTACGGFRRSGLPLSGRGQAGPQACRLPCHHGDRPVGSASCQLHLMPYPAVLEAEHMLQGYIWSVWVEPGYRRQGISSKLVSMAVDYLRTLGCTGVVLHSSEAGRSVYERLGSSPHMRCV